MTREAAYKFLSFLEDLGFRLSDPVSYNSVFGLAESHGLTLYDAAYLDLALREGAALATLDVVLRRAAESAGVALFVT